MGSIGCNRSDLDYFTIQFMIRPYMKGGKFTHDIQANGKVVLITGANTGIGKTTAHELAARGAKVYLACRNIQLGNSARDEIISNTKNKNVFCRVIDLSSLESIRDFVRRFQKEETTLDILINNAGIMKVPQSYTADGFEMQMGVNHLGHFLLTNLLLNLLKATPNSRIVVLSSFGHIWGKIKKDDMDSRKHYNDYDAYFNSKLANVLFTRELAKKLQGSSVTVNAVHPGIVHTELGRYSEYVNTFAGKILMFPIYWMFFKTPLEGAQTTLYCALHPELAGVSGRYFSDCAEKDVADVGKAREFRNSRSRVQL